jgi:hypothetical protein
MLIPELERTLKPCKCGHRVTIKEVFEIGTIITCPNPYCEEGPVRFISKPEQAAAIWNERRG